MELAGPVNISSIALHTCCLSELESEREGEENQLARDWIRPIADTQIAMNFSAF